MATLTQDELKSLLAYDPETGMFTWVAKNNNRIVIGSTAGHVHKGHGYVQVKINKKLYLAHRLAWLYETGNWPVNQIDHINRIKTDNRFCNLRAATPSENAQNHPKLTRGVSWNKREKKWGAYLRIRGKQLHLGWHKTYESALAARKQAEVTHFPFRS